MKVVSTSSIFMPMYFSGLKSEVISVFLQKGFINDVDKDYLGDWLISYNHKRTSILWVKDKFVSVEIENTRLNDPVRNISYFCAF